jgi:DMSO/TMAO reductase YedYZ molybdopterin-dependent catalytic subunit
VADAGLLDPARRGEAVALAGLLALAEPMPEADYIGLHASADDFHASVPLAAVKDRAYVVYRIDGRPLSAAEGGPLRLFIVDFAACHSDEIDECSNVKFLDRIELTRGRGFDNRPSDEDEHEALHRRQS